MPMKNPKEAMAPATQSSGYSEAFKTMPCAVVIFEKDGRDWEPVYRNLKYQRMFDYANAMEAALKDDVFGWVHPNDRKNIEIMTEKSKEGIPGQQVCRLKRKDDVICWVVAFSWRLESPGQTGAVVLAFSEFASVPGHEKLIALQEQRYRTIAENINSVSFDYDVIQDRLFYIVRREGQAPEEKIIEQYLQNLTKSKMVHSSTCREYRNALLGKRNVDYVDFLCRFADGQYHWCRAHYRAVYVGENKDFHTVGRVVITTDELHQEVRIQMDKVTGTLDRAAADMTIELVLKDQIMVGSRAIVLFKLQGLSEIDEVMGTETGNLVLRNVGSLIAENLRGNDVIGRFSGSIFVALIRNAGSRQAVLDMIARVQDAVGGLMGTIRLEVPINLLAGIALMPEDATDYKSLVAVASSQIGE
ncbi:MAG: diguanylate cyclase [Eubacteriaceae bacterium]|nr:diguanylate cyclase [Eubacteriaceae bacterium]MDD4507353.1 diguanylate cyclase [Eubacteriaceae bacterium]